MSITRTFLLIAIPLVLILAACGPGPSVTPTLGAEPPEAVDAAKAALGQELGIPVDQIETVSFGRVEWPNACLGLERGGEACAQVITPGYEVVLSAEGQEYIYRTSMTGDIVRRDTTQE